MPFQDLVTEGAAGALRTKTVSLSPSFMEYEEKHSSGVWTHRLAHTLHERLPETSPAHL